MPADPRSCPHVNFVSEVDVTRVVRDGTDVVIAHTADIRIRCRDCGTPFWFPGLGTGVSWSGPVTSADGFEMRTPIVEANRRHQRDPSLVEVKIAGSDGMKGQRR